MGPSRITFIGAALLALSAGCEAPIKTGISGAGQESPSLFFEGFRARGTLVGVKQWEAEARTARVWSESQKAVADEVTLRYFHNGRPVSIGKARRAEIDLKSYDLMAEGEVWLKGQNGAELFTEKLYWDNAKERVSSSSRVKVKRGGSVLTGLGLRADRRLEKVEVLEDVKVETESVEDLRKLGNEKP